MSATARIVAVAVLLSACAGPVPVETTVSTPTRPSTTIPVTTTTPGVEVVLQSCGTPPVTFSPLCEIYELLGNWHVDGPPDPDVLSAAAVEGLSRFETDEIEEPPRSLICAIPDAAFVPLCDAIAVRVATESMPVGPAVEASMMHMIDQTLDPFTYYLPPGQTGSFRLNGVVGGVGFLLDARDAAGSKCARLGDTCRLRVIVVLENNAGIEAGLKPGDIITAVDGQPVNDQGFTSVVSQIAGDESGLVTLSLDRDGAAIDVAVERRPLEVPTVEYGVPTPGVGYLRIPDFEADIPDLVEGALEEMGTLGTLVVDLRDNPGGLIDAVLDVADQFVESGVLMRSSYPDDDFEYTATAGGLALSGRVIVLVNGGTASAAEILTAMLRDRRSATVVGSNTFGKNAVQIPFDLRNGGAFYVAVARWSSPNGESAEVDGLSPDRMVAWPTNAETTDIVNTALEAAS